jgi:hypothetical protein
MAGLIRFVVDFPPMLFFGWIALSAWAAFQFSWYRRARTSWAPDETSAERPAAVEAMAVQTEAPHERSTPLSDEQAMPEVVYDSPALTEADLKEWTMPDRALAQPESVEPTERSETPARSSRKPRHQRRQPSARPEPVLLLSTAPRTDTALPDRTAS